MLSHTLEGDGRMHDMLMWLALLGLPGWLWLTLAVTLSSSVQQEPSGCTNTLPHLRNNRLLVACSGHNVGCGPSYTAPKTLHGSGWGHVPFHRLLLRAAAPVIKIPAPIKVVAKKPSPPPVCEDDVVSTCLPHASAKPCWC